MAGRLKGEVAIVIGAGSSGPGIGIGKAISLLFAREEAQVVLVDNHEDRANETLHAIKEEGGDAIAVTADISDPAAGKRIVDTTVAQYGTVSVLVNNAAYTPMAGVTDTSAELFSQVLAVNVTGPFLTSQAAIPIMVERGGGSIVNITSISAVRSPSGHQTAYAASKAALTGLMVDIVNEHGTNNVRVNCIAPGGIDTPLRKKTMREVGINPDDVPYGVSTSLGHPGDGWDIAYAALFFASSEARFVTGAHLLVDGGLSTRYPNP